MPGSKGRWKTIHDVKAKKKVQSDHQEMLDRRDNEANPLLLLTYSYCLGKKNLSLAEKMVLFLAMSSTVSALIPNYDLPQFENENGVEGDSLRLNNTASTSALKPIVKSSSLNNKQFSEQIIPAQTIKTSSRKKNVEKTTKINDLISSSFDLAYREIAKTFDSLLMNQFIKNKLIEKWKQEAFLVNLVFKAIPEKQPGYEKYINKHKLTVHSKLKELMEDLKKYPQLFAIEKQFGTLKSSAIFHDDVEILRLLNKIDGNSGRDFFQGAYHGSFKLIEKLITENVDINKSYSNGDTALHLAMSGLARDFIYAYDDKKLEKLKADRLKIVAIIATNANINVLNDNQQTALSIALDLDWYDAAYLLLKLGAKFEKGKMRNGKTPGQFMHQNRVYQKLYIEFEDCKLQENFNQAYDKAINEHSISFENSRAGDQLKEQYRQENFLTYLALQAIPSQICGFEKYLTNNKINQVSHRMVLREAIKKYPELQRLERKMGVLKNSAMLHDDIELMLELNKLPILEYNQAELSDLQMGCNFGSLVLVQHLLINGTALNQKNVMGTELHLTVNGLMEYDSLYAHNKTKVEELKGNRLGIIKKIIDAGTNINELNNYQQTALSIALNLNCYEIVKLLVDLGADLNIGITNNRKTPKQFMLENEKYKKILDAQKSNYWPWLLGSVVLTGLVSFGILKSKKSELVIKQNDKKNYKALRTSKVKASTSYNKGEKESISANVKTSTGDKKEKESITAGQTGVIDKKIKRIKQVRDEIILICQYIDDLQTPIWLDARMRYYINASDKNANVIKALKEVSPLKGKEELEVKLQCLQEDFDLTQKTEEESKKYIETLDQLQVDLDAFFRSFESKKSKFESFDKKYQQWMEDFNSPKTTRTNSNDPIVKTDLKKTNKIIKIQTEFVQIVDKEKLKKEKKLPQQHVNNNCSYISQNNGCSPKTRERSNHFFPTINPESAEKTAISCYEALSEQLENLSAQDLRFEITENSYKLALAYFVFRFFNALLEMARADDEKSELIYHFANLRNCLVKCVLSLKLKLDVFADFCFELQKEFQGIYEDWQKDKKINPDRVTEFYFNIKKHPFNDSLKEAWKNYQDRQNSVNDSLYELETYLKSLLDIFDNRATENVIKLRNLAASKAVIVTASQIYHDSIENSDALKNLDAKQILQSFFGELRRNRNKIAHKAEDFFDINEKKIQEISNQIPEILPVIKKLYKSENDSESCKVPRSILKGSSPY